MYRPADPQTRSGYITGLRELADYLAANPAVPVALHGDLLVVSVNSTEEGGCFQVRQAARLLGVTVTDETAGGGHYYAEKAFGPIGYRVVSIPGSCMARHHALWSYDGSVQPDSDTRSPVPDA
jgi:hypothetical protein